MEVFVLYSLYVYGFPEGHLKYSLSSYVSGKHHHWIQLILMVRCRGIYNSAQIFFHTRGCLWHSTFTAAEMTLAHLNIIKSSLSSGESASPTFFAISKVPIVPRRLNSVRLHFWKESLQAHSGQYCSHPPQQVFNSSFSIQHIISGSVWEAKLLLKFRAD